MDKQEPMNPHWYQRIFSIFRFSTACKVLFISVGILMIAACVALLQHVMMLPRAAQQPVDLLFVLGGSIRREIYVSQLAKQFPKTRILISAGSDAPCILKLFERINAPQGQVWLEKCADSTFGNFFFTIPILKQWQIRHVKLITSPSHLPRAQWMAQILFGAHGIWVELDLTEETGVPGNQEFQIKTALDLTRALIWAIVSQGFNPSCREVVSLVNVDVVEWCQEGFSCELQGDVSPKQICESINL